MMGATAVALSEAERDRYYVSRSMFDFLGNKDGADIFRDRVTGEYYSDDVCFISIDFNKKRHLLHNLEN